MPIYKTKVVWTGGHDGKLTCGNGAKMSFSAPPALEGRSGVMTPEDAYVSALNTCFHMMFIWATERLRIELVSYECEAEGHVVDLLDRTSEFDQTVLRPRIRVKSSSASRVEKALEPRIEIEP
jgi:organic hydroperoxide reductase OsmC/OhrA